MTNSLNLDGGAADILVALVCQLQSGEALLCAATLGASGAVVGQPRADP